MDRQAVLTAYSRQVRQSTSPDGTGAVFETDDVVIRRVAPADQEGSGIFWSDLDAANADAVIARQVEYFRDRGARFEWKIFDSDEPADLPERLVAAGFVAEDPESFMVADAAEVLEALHAAQLPAGVTLREVTDESGLRQMTEVSQEVFGEDRSELTESIRAQLETAPDTVVIILAMADDQAVCSARIEFLASTDFAGLWGGGTLPQWRGRGIYRALVRHRAELALRRGYKYLTVDASPDSRPILEKVGFSRLAVTTPYIWSPEA